MPRPRCVDRDAVALSIRGARGTLVACNDSRSLRDQMRRAPAAGAASLAYDGVFAPADGLAQFDTKAVLSLRNVF